MNKKEWLKAQQYYKSKINKAIDSLRYSYNSDKILNDLVNNRISIEKSEKITIIDMPCNASDLGGMEYIETDRYNQ